MIYHVISFVFTLGYYLNVMAYLSSQDQSMYPIKVYQATVIYHFMCCVLTGEKLNFTQFSRPNLNYPIFPLHRSSFVYFYVLSKTRPQTFSIRRTGVFSKDSKHKLSLMRNDKNCRLFINFFQLINK